MNKQALVSNFEQELVDAVSFIFNKKTLRYIKMTDNQKSERDTTDGIVIENIANYPYTYGYAYKCVENGYEYIRLEWNYYVPSNPELSTTFYSLTVENFFPTFIRIGQLLHSFEAFAPLYNKWAEKPITTLYNGFCEMGFKIETE